MSQSPVIKALRVIAVIDETPSAKTLVLEPVGKWLPEYRSGQFFTFLFDTKFGEKRRSYSVSSSPELGQLLSVTVKRIPNGEISRPVFEKTQVGDILRTVGSAGFFTLPEKIIAGQQFCFFAAGSGITPCISLIRTLLHTTSGNVTLIYSNSKKSETIFYNEIRKLMIDFKDRFRVRFLFSDNQNILERRYSKWLSDILLDEFFPHGTESVLFYICGPFEYMQTARIALLVRTFPENIREEKFDHFPRLILPEPPDHEGHMVTVKIADQIHRIFVKFPDSITKAASKKNIVLPFSCEAGRCGSCIATCTKGELWMTYNEVLVDSEIKKGRVLTCQAFPIYGDAEVVYK